MAGEMEPCDVCGCWPCAHFPGEPPDGFSVGGDLLDTITAERDDALARIAELEAQVAGMREALADLLSWFPDKPSDPEWRIKAGEHGADDAVKIARVYARAPSTTDTGEAP